MEFYSTRFISILEISNCFNSQRDGILHILSETTDIPNRFQFLTGMEFYKHIALNSSNIDEGFNSQRDGILHLYIRIQL